jgi:hypothetical protein
VLSDPLLDWRRNPNITVAMMDPVGMAQRALRQGLHRGAVEGVDHIARRWGRAQLVRARQREARQAKLGPYTRTRGLRYVHPRCPIPRNPEES